MSLKEKKRGKKHITWMTDKQDEEEEKLEEKHMKVNKLPMI